MPHPKDEATIERTFVDKCPFFTIKLNASGDVGIPDRLILLDRGRPAFIEFKVPGETPSPKQEEWLDRLRALGYPAQWFTRWPSALKWILKMNLRP